MRLTLDGADALKRAAHPYRRAASLRIKEKIDGLGCDTLRVIGGIECWEHRPDEAESWRLMS
jgi:hypothetical protein